MTTPPPWAPPGGWKLAFWLVAGLLALLAIDALSEILLPFVAGMAVAYFLDPAADWLEEKGLSRVMATTVITAIFALVAGAAILLFIPLLVGQIDAFAKAAPNALAQLRIFLETHLGPIEELISGFRGDGENGPQMETATAIAQFVAQTAKRVAGGVLSAANMLSLILITPIVTFYLLRDWDRMVAAAHDLMPRDGGPTIERLAGEIDKTLSAFVRGTGVVCLVLGGFYATALTIAGLQFGIVIGLLAGLISFIPFVGSIVGLIASVGMAVWQFGEIQPVLIVAAIFVIGQAIEGNFLTPKLVGGSVGLHPVWVIFAMLAGGSLFGFVGVMLAVPAAAAAGVLVRYGVERYRSSALYRGDDAPGERAG